MKKELRLLGDALYFTGETKEGEALLRRDAKGISCWRYGLLGWISSPCG